MGPRVSSNAQTLNITYKLPLGQSHSENQLFLELRLKSKSKPAQGDIMVLNGITSPHKLIKTGYIIWNRYVALF